MRWVTDVFGRGSRVACARRLRLGGWHVNHALDVVDAEGGTHRLVLRRWARPGWEVADPDYTVKREIRVLKLLSSMQIPAPGMVAADPDGASCDVPAILLTRLTGHPPRPEDTAADGFCRQLAETLARIHDVHATAEAQLDAYRLYYDRSRANPAPWMPATSVWEQATAAVREAPPPTTMTLIHRDYHPENTLVMVKIGMLVAQLSVRRRCAGLTPSRAGGSPVGRDRCAGGQGGRPGRREDWGHREGRTDPGPAATRPGGR